MEGKNSWFTYAGTVSCAHVNSRAHINIQFSLPCPFPGSVECFTAMRNLRVTLQVNVSAAEWNVRSICTACGTI